MTKSLGSRNPINVVLATIECLVDLTKPEDKASQLGKETSDLEGTWIDNSYMKHPVVDSNCDIYYIDDDGSEKLLLKYRKNSFTNTLIRNGWSSYKDLAEFNPTLPKPWIIIF